MTQFPTPQALKQAGRRKWQKFLHTHKLWRKTTAEKRLEIFARADQFVSPSSAVTAAKSLLAVTIAKQLRTLELQIDEYRRRIQKLFRDHPDHELFDSLPGAGQKLAPRLLGELGSNREMFASFEALQCYAGTAPVTEQSGRRRHTYVRRMCNKRLRATVHLWVQQSCEWCAWARSYYERKREQGKSRAQALRCLGQRWLKILWKMWQKRQTYDESRHMLSLTRHGSWVIRQLLQPQP